MVVIVARVSGAAKVANGLKIHWPRVDRSLRRCLVRNEWAEIAATGALMQEAVPRPSSPACPPVNSDVSLSQRSYDASGVCFGRRALHRGPRPEWLCHSAHKQSDRSEPGFDEASAYQSGSM